MSTADTIYRADLDPNEAEEIGEVVSHAARVGGYLHIEVRLRPKKIGALVYTPTALRGASEPKAPPA